MVHPKGLQVHARRPKGVAYTALGVEPLRCGVWGEQSMTEYQACGFGISTADYPASCRGVNCELVPGNSRPQVAGPGRAALAARGIGISKASPKLLVLHSPSNMI